MIIKSFATIENKLEPIELELMILPGLPQIHFLGLADQGIKELDRKIRSAFRYQGFQFPKAHQIIVNLRPVHLKKKSRGLDLAVAVALLMETKQIPKIISSEDFYIYGELSLSGHVQAVDDFEQLPINPASLILTGDSKGNSFYQRSIISELKDLKSEPKILAPTDIEINFERPNFGLDLKYSESESQLIKMISIAEHNTLLTGPPGTGKSTLAKAVGSFLNPPKIEDWYEIKNIFSDLNLKDFKWRPVVQPHHSNTVISLIGGGVPVRPGDVTRAHKGILIMDEFLEFDSRVQEALREPLEEGVLRLSRKNSSVKLPTKFLLLATTNLCPCGNWLPDTMINCIRSRIRCQSARQKLSGPLLDRFDIVYFKSERSSQKISGFEILEHLVEIKARACPTVEDFSHVDSLGVPQAISKLTQSERRLRSIHRVALSLSLVNGHENILSSDWEEALEYSLWPMIKLTQDLGGI